MSVFRKIKRALISFYTRFEIRPFALLPLTCLFLSGCLERDKWHGWVNCIMISWTLSTVLRTPKNDYLYDFCSIFRKMVDILGKILIRNIKDVFDFPYHKLVRNQVSLRNRLSISLLSNFLLKDSYFAVNGNKKCYIPSRQVYWVTSKNNRLKYWVSVKSEKTKNHRNVFLMSL